MTNISAHSNLREKEPAITGRDKLVALSFALLVILLGGMLIVQGVTAVDHDDGIYVITAKALAQQEGYRLIQLPDAPVQTKYPLFYPVLLAIIWKLFPAFPANLLWMQWITLLTGAGTAACSYLYLVRFNCCSRLIAALVVLLSITTARFLFLSSICMSDMPFAFSLVLAMWALNKHLEYPLDSRKSQLFLGLLLALPILLRTIGIAFIVVVIYCAIRHRRIMRMPVIGASLPLIPYALWMATFSVWHNAASNDSYYTNYISWWHTYCVPLFGRILALNAFNICQASNHMHFARWQFMPIWVAWLAALLGLAGSVNLVRRLGDRHVLPKLLIAYLAVLLVWPWPPFRFLIPVLPFLYCYSMTAIAAIFKKAPRILKPIGAVILVVPLIANADAIRKDIAKGKANHYPGYMLRSMPSETVSWSHYQDMFDWMKQHSKPSDLFISGMDPMLYLYTGRRGIRPYASRPSSMYYEDTAPVLGTLEEVMANIRHYKPQYLVLSPMPGLTEEIPYAQLVVESQKNYPGWLEPVYLGKDKRFVIWKIIK